MKSKFLFVALLLCAYCCSPNRGGSVKIVDIGSSKMAVLSLDELNSNIAKIPLSSLVDNCELVQLETIEEAFFKPWFTTVTENYIGIVPESGPFG